MFPLLLTSVLLTAPPALPPLKLAAPGLEAVGLEPARGEFYGEQLADRLGDLGIEVLTQKQIAAVLGLSRQRQLLGSCADDNTPCATELVSALGVDGIVLGSVARVGSTFQLSAKVVSASDGRRLAGYSATASSEEALLEAIAHAAARLSAELRAVLRHETVTLPPDREEVVITPRPLRAVSWVPAALGVGLIATSVVLGLNAERQYQTLTGPGPVTNPDQLVSSGKQLQLLSNLSLGVGLAAIGAGVVFFFVGGRAAPVALVTPSGVTFGVVGVLP